MDHMLNAVASYLLSTFGCHWEVCRTTSQILGVYQLLVISFSTHLYSIQYSRQAMQDVFTWQAMFDTYFPAFERSRARCDFEGGGSV